MTTAKKAAEGRCVFRAGVSNSVNHALDALEREPNSPARRRAFLDAVGLAKESFTSAETRTRLACQSFILAALNAVSRSIGTPAMFDCITRARRALEARDRLPERETANKRRATIC